MNAKEEFINHVEATPKIPVICAKIGRGIRCETSIEALIVLNEGYSKEDYDNFLYELDFEYHEGYGLQQVFGVIWYSDGTWSERNEYDGSEWWSYKKCPEFFETFKKFDLEKQKGENK